MVLMLQPERTGQKDDQTDADAIGEAGSRPRTRCVPVKSAAPQAGRTGHRARDLRVTEGTALANQGRGLLRAYGSVIAQGIQRLRRTLPEGRVAAETLPTLGCEVVEEVRERVVEWDRRSAQYDPRIEQLAKQNEAARRLLRGEGGGPLTATAVVATSGDGPAFAPGRQCAAGVGVGPRPPSTGGKTSLGRLTNQGKVYLRTRLSHGARAVLPFSATRPD